MVSPPLSPCPPQAGSWCSRLERRPYVRLIVLGNEPRHANGLGPRIPKLPSEFDLCTNESHPLTRSSPCEAPRKSLATVQRRRRALRWPSSGASRHPRVKPEGRLFPRKGKGCPATPTSRDLHVLEVAGLAVDADARRGDPARVFAGLVAGLHQRVDEGHVGVVRQPRAALRLPLVLGEDLARRADALAGELADFAIEALVRLGELEGDPRLLDHLVPAIDPALTVLDVVVEQARVGGAQRRDLVLDDLAVDDPPDRIGRVGQDVIVLEVRLVEAAL